MYLFIYVFIYLCNYSFIYVCMFYICIYIYMWHAAEAEETLDERVREAFCDRSECLLRRVLRQRFRS